MTPKEALEELKQIDIIIDGCAWNYKDTNYKEMFDVLEQALTELEELKRDTPMKPTIKDRNFKKTYHCPNCKTCVGQENSGIKFGKTPICPNCKLKLDWSDDK